MMNVAKAPPPPEQHVAVAEIVAIVERIVGPEITAFGFYVITQHQQVGMSIRHRSENSRHDLTACLVVRRFVLALAARIARRKV